MAELQFDEGQEFARPSLPPSLLTRVVLQTGLAQTEKGAQQVLLVVAAIFIIIAFYVAVSSFESATTPQNPVLLADPIQ